MKHEEAIKILDETIIAINTLSTFSSNDPKQIIEGGKLIIKYAETALKKINASEITLKALKAISFESEYTGPFATKIYGIEGTTRGLNQSYVQAVEAVRSLLNQEKERRKQLLNEETQQKALKEQKKGNWIQIATLICSIVAALAALYPIIEPLIKKMLN